MQNTQIRSESRPAKFIFNELMIPKLRSPLIPRVIVYIFTPIPNLSILLEGFSLLNEILFNLLLVRRMIVLFRGQCLDPEPLVHRLTNATRPTPIRLLPLRVVVATPIFRPVRLHTVAIVNVVVDHQATRLPRRCPETEFNTRRPLASFCDDVFSVTFPGGRGSNDGFHAGCPEEDRGRKRFQKRHTGD